MSDHNAPIHLKQLALFDEADAEITNRGFVYFVYSENAKLTKIGFAADLKKRQSQYTTHNAEKLEWLFAIKTENYKWLERELHATFYGQRRHGEWFALEPYDLVWIYRRIPGCFEISDTFKQWITDVYQESRRCKVISPLFRKSFRKAIKTLEDPWDDGQIWNLYATLAYSEEGVA